MEINVKYVYLGIVYFVVNAVLLYFRRKRQMNRALLKEKENIKEKAKTK